MSEVRLNVLDADGSCNGTIHGGVADAAVAALSAEPESIGELRLAIGRFIRLVDDYEPFGFFDPGELMEPWDAGIVVIDLNARVVAVESTYSLPAAAGEVAFHDGSSLTNVRISYQVSDDWLFVDTIDEYLAVRDRRKVERSASPPLDARPVLYDAVVEFIVKECLAARDSSERDPITAIHARWLTEPRDDLRGKSPRDVLLSKLEYIDADLWSRETQWSRLREQPPGLTPESAAYRFAGFGMHEVVLYYDMVRLLLERCWEKVTQEDSIQAAEEVARLEQIKTDWLNRTEPDNDGRSPAEMIACERMRVPLVSPPDDVLIDDDCPTCRALARGEFGLSFMHLSNCNMDPDYPFAIFDFSESSHPSGSDHDKDLGTRDLT
jgi:hypothetical protein